MRDDSPSSADFSFWEMLDQHEIIAKKRGMKSPLENFLELQRYYANSKGVTEASILFLRLRASPSSSNSSRRRVDLLISLRRHFQDLYQSGYRYHKNQQR